jgi:hypothetical protein
MKSSMSLALMRGAFEHELGEGKSSAERLQDVRVAFELTDDGSRYGAREEGYAEQS